MSRIARKKSAAGHYHIVFRGINRQTIFHDDEDRTVFLNRLKLVRAENGYELIAFCIMNNHVHLLVRETGVEIGHIVRRVLSSFVFWYNGKYERVGHLFQDRFKSEPINSDAHLLRCVRYILQNPVKAKTCATVWDFPWSNAQLFLEEKPSFAEVGMIQEMLQPRAALIEFMEEREKDEFLEWETRPRLTDERLREKIIKILKGLKFNEILDQGKKERKQLLMQILRIGGVNVAQIARVTGVPYHFIRYAGNR